MAACLSGLAAPGNSHPQRLHNGLHNSGPAAEGQRRPLADLPPLQNLKAVRDIGGNHRRRFRVEDA
jgi:hypothetical protein